MLATSPRKNHLAQNPQGRDSRMDIRNLYRKLEKDKRLGMSERMMLDAWNVRGISDKYEELNENCQRGK
jgi:hypothetical protein